MINFLILNIMYIIEKIISSDNFARNYIIFRNVKLSFNVNN